MKTVAFRSLPVVLCLAILPACGGDNGNGDMMEPPAQTTTVQGTVSIPVGIPGTPDNTRVALYADFADWQADRTLRIVAAGAGGSYAFTNMTPGTYYIDAWKDNNTNGLFDSGDFFGVFGTGNTINTAVVSPFDVAMGQTATINVAMFVIP